MLNRVITVDFSKKSGKIKPLNCINGAPRSGGYNLPFDVTEEFLELSVPLVRTSASDGEYGFNQFLNIHCIFPNFDADENLEESYNFLPTDLYIQSIRNTGAEILFRLGESAEPYSYKIYTRPPRDKEKWARICEHIVMHYNEGWANGFKYNIKMWEIWNAPDSATGFTGEAVEYYELYRICANHLKERFPKIKVGAYGARGFYSLNRLDASEEIKRCIPFMQQFFSYITKEPTKAPLDFFTWACYTSNPDELAMHVKYARNYLDVSGLKKTKSIICEYNTATKGDTPPGLLPEFPSELGASLILAQKGEVDMMIYSTSDIRARENALFTMDDHTKTHRYAAFNVMRSFGKAYKLGTSFETSGDYRKELYSLAAGGQNTAEVLLVTRSYSGRVEVILKDAPYDTCSVVKTVSGGERGEGAVYRAENIAINGAKIILPVKQNEIYEISLFTKNEE